jgi:CheY-like chemotaxis protein
MEATKVLLLSSDFSRFDAIGPVLEGAGLEVHRMMSGVAALKLAARVVFKVILIADPLEDLPYLEFLKATRAEGSPCLQSGIIILLPPEAMDSSKKLLDRGANRVLSLDCEGQELRRALSDLLGVAIRAKVRTMLQIELLVGPKKKRVLCQTENLSRTGFLVRGNTQPIGTKFDFELKLPGQPRPIHGAAEVVRHTSWTREKMEGFGASFVSLAGDGKQLLDSFLRTQKA